MSERSYSLRRRLLLWLLLPLCTIGIIALADAYRAARETANEVFDRVLAGSALAISERVFVNDDGVLDVDIPYVALDMLTSAAQDRVFYRLEGQNGEFVTGYDRLEIPTLRPEAGERFSFVDGVFRKTPIRIATYDGVASTGERTIRYRIAVAETMNARNSMAEKILLRSALRQAMLIGAAAIIVWIAVTRALIPLGRLEEAIGRRNPNDLREIRHRVPAEVSGLVGRINGFMRRLENALEALRHFTANASHQIRTPLAIVRTQLVLAERSQTLEEARIALKACDQAIGDAEHTLAQLLLLARVDELSSKQLSEVECNLTETARSATTNQVIRAAEAGFDLGFEGEEVYHCRGETVLVRELITNLIDNAVRHAHRGTTITVRVFEDETAIVLQVEDDGPGIPGDQRSRVLSRFTGSASARPEIGGLGLPIVSEIARIFGAELQLRAGRNDAGLLAEVRFRRSESNPMRQSTDERENFRA